MSDFVRNLIKWILVVILAVLVIFLIIKVANRGKQKVEGNPVTPIAETVKDEDKEKEKEHDSNKELTAHDELISGQTEKQAEGELVIHAEDTASDAGLTGVIGIVILGATTFYLLKLKKKENVEK